MVLLILIKLLVCFLQLQHSHVFVIYLHKSTIFFFLHDYQLCNVYDLMNVYFHIDSFQDKISIEKKKTAREYFDLLKKKKLFTPSDVIFMQFLLRESNCAELNEKCIAYATTQKALCFYEELPSKIHFYFHLFQYSVFSRAKKPSSHA